jgi:hypothetical protein
MIAGKLPLIFHRCNTKTSIDWLVLLTNLWNEQANDDCQRAILQLYYGENILHFDEHIFILYKKNLKNSVLGLADFIEVSQMSK